ncbi:MAG: hypothetical protein KY475_16775 [Planctomycetes bacterium]|nr:hypothetical protein [Planctomycetota bacterium]
MKCVTITTSPEGQKFRQQALERQPQPTLTRQRKREDDDQQRAGDENGSGHRRSLLLRVRAAGLAAQKSSPETGIEPIFGA